MTKLEKAAAALARAERMKTEAFHQASLAREAHRRAVRALIEALAEQRAQAVRA